MIDVDVEVGAEVQSYDEDGNVVDGVVTAVTPAKRAMEKEYWRFTTDEQRDMYPTVTVTFEDNSVEEVSTSGIDPRDSEVEREFRNTNLKISDKIHTALAKACEYLDKAVDLSEKHGVPFSSCISYLGQSYYPTTIQEKFPEIENGFVQGITEAYSEYGMSYGGWEHSAVC